VERCIVQHTYSNIEIKREGENIMTAEGTWPKTTGDILYASEVNAMFHEVYNGAIAGAAAQEITSDTTFTCAAGETMIIFADILNSSGGGTEYSLYFNADTTATNYDANISSKANNAIITGTVPNGELSMFNTRTFYQSDNKPMSLVNVVYDTALDSYRYSHKWQTAASITSVTIKAADAQGIGIGSRMIIWLAE